MPDHDTATFVVPTTPVAACTRVVGTVVSIVFVHVGVRIGALASKTTVAWLAIAVAWARPALGITVKVTAPWPFLPSVSGGRKPSVGSLGTRCVTGSMVSKVQRTRPVVVSTLPCTRTEIVASTATVVA